MNLFGPQISFIALNLDCLAIAFLILVFSHGLYFREKKGAGYWPLLCTLMLFWFLYSFTENNKPCEP